MHSGIGMALVSPLGRFLDVNPALCRFLGYSESELLTRDFQSLTHPDDLDDDLDHVEKLLAGEIETYAMEKRYRHKLGHDLWGMLTVSLVREDDGTALFFLSQIQDFNTTRKNAEDLARARDEAERADQAKSQFLAMMSHEIRTPMNAVIGFASLLRSTSLNGEQKNFLQMIESSGERLLGLINDILDFSKIESGTFTVHSAAMELRPCLHEAFLLMRPAAEAKGLAFELEVDPEVPFGLISDRDRLIQILINLLGNAVKFTQKGYVIFRVGVRPGEGGNGQWEFRVTDSGPGIVPGMEEKIFQLFVRCDDVRTRSHEGSGLGLAISRRLAVLLNGEIGVRNVPEGGAEFCLHLNAPLVKQPVEAVART